MQLRSAVEVRHKCVQVQDAATQISDVCFLTAPQACTLHCYAFWPLTIHTSALWRTGSARSRSPAPMPYWGGCFLQTWRRITLPNSSKKVTNVLWSKQCSFPSGWNTVGLEACSHSVHVIVLHWRNNREKVRSYFTKIPLSLFYSLLRAAWKSYPADADLGTLNTPLSWRIDPIRRSVDIKYESLAECWSPSEDSSDSQ